MGSMSKKYPELGSLGRNWKARKKRVEKIKGGKVSGDLKDTRSRIDEAYVAMDQEKG